MGDQQPLPAPFLSAWSQAQPLDLRWILSDLAARGVNDVLIEAGAALTGAALRSGLVDELIVYVAPRLLGAGRDLVDLAGIERLADAPRLRYAEVRQVGPDLRLTLVPDAG